MASSQKFPSGLNKWMGSDKPTRSDFVRDNEILDEATRAEVFSATLPGTAWTQDGDTFSKTISDPLFSEKGYLYRVSVAPAQVFVVADLGGIVMASVADGSAVFQCRSQPESDIAVQIERVPRKEDA